MRNIVRFLVTSALAASVLGTVVPAQAVAVSEQPDGWIRIHGGDWVGNDVYLSSGQTVAKKIAPGKTLVFDMAAQNDGSVVDSFRVSGCDSGGGFAVSYWSGNEELTKVVKNGNAVSRPLDPGEKEGKIAVHIKRKSSVDSGTMFVCYVSFISEANNVQIDTVAAQVTAK